jgi:hypothetical protein
MLFSPLLKNLEVEILDHPLHNNFLEFVHSNGLIDLGFSGTPFTWDNKRQGCFHIKERLDRGLSNQEWVLLFPDALMIHLPASTSNHNPILLSTDGNLPLLPKPFKFEEFWTRDSSSHLVVAEAWSTLVIGSAGFILSRKFKASKVALKSWNVTQFGNIQLKIKSMLAEIAKLQSSPPSPDLAVREESLQLALQEELLREESLWKQKSRDLWLSSSDLNTKYFHASTAIRRRFNSITSISTNAGLYLKTRQEIGLHFTEYFQSLYASSNPTFDAELESLFPSVILDSENVDLCGIPDEAEIRSAIYSLGLTQSSRA